jgi:hypothetical protein
MNNSDSNCTKQKKTQNKETKKSMVGGEWWVMCAVLDAHDAGCVCR